jgi:cell division septation protein DedD
LVGPFSDKEVAEQALKRLEARKLTYGDAKIVEFE